MAYLRCDECGSSDTNTFGSWDTPIKILCRKCSEKLDHESTSNRTKPSDLTNSGFIL